MRRRVLLTSILALVSLGLVGGLAQSPVGVEDFRPVTEAMLRNPAAVTG